MHNQYTMIVGGLSMERISNHGFIVSVSHYNDIITNAMAFQITGDWIVCSTASSGVDQRKHQLSVSLAFVSGIHRWPVDSPHKGPVTRKMFPFDDVIMGKFNSQDSCDVYVPYSFQRRAAIVQTNCWVIRHMSLPQNVRRITIFGAWLCDQVLYFYAKRSWYKCEAVE